jgi:hypothetical protein
MSVTDVFEVQAFGEKDHGGQWYCQAVSPAPIKDLFAWGKTFTEARKGLASMVVAAIALATVAAVRINAVTHKTFCPADLDAEP